MRAGREYNSEDDPENDEHDGPSCQRMHFSLIIIYHAPS